MAAKFPIVVSMMDVFRKLRVLHLLYLSSLSSQNNNTALAPIDDRAMCKLRKLSIVFITLFKFLRQNWRMISAAMATVAQNTGNASSRIMADSSLKASSPNSVLFVLLLK